MPASSCTRGRKLSWPPKPLGCRLSTWSTLTTKTWRGWDDRPERELSWASQVKFLKSVPVPVPTSTCLCKSDISDFCVADHSQWLHFICILYALHSSLWHNNRPSSTSCCEQRSDNPTFQFPLLSLATLSCSYVICENRENRMYELFDHCVF